MNLRFLTMVGESYVADNNLIGIVDPNKVGEYLLETLREVRDEDDFLYEEIGNMNKLDQQRVFRNFLDLNLRGYSEIEESILSFYNELVKNYEPIEEGAGDAIREQAAKINDWLKSHYTDFHKAVSSLLVKGGSVYAANIASEQLLGTGLGSLIGQTALPLLTSWWVVPIMLGLFFARRPIMKSIFKTISEFGEVLLFLAKLIKKSSNVMRYRYIVIYQNEAKCYQKHNIDPKKIGAFAAVAARGGDKNKLAELLPFNDVQTAMNLRSCYLESKLEQINLLLEFYYECEMKTGGWNEIKDFSDSALNKLFATVSVSAACEEYHTMAKKAIETYNDVVDTLYGSGDENTARIMKRKILVSFGDVQDKMKKQKQPQSGQSYNKYQGDKRQR